MKVRNICKVNNKNTRTTSLTNKSIYSEQVIVSRFFFFLQKLFEEKCAIYMFFVICRHWLSNEIIFILRTGFSKLFNDPPVEQLIKLEPP